jgi:hypothetical protein
MMYREGSKVQPYSDEFPNGDRHRRSGRVRSRIAIAVRERAGSSIAIAVPGMALAVPVWRWDSNRV